LSPFQVVYGRDPHLPDYMQTGNIPVPDVTPVAKKYEATLRKIQEVNKVARDSLLLYHNKMHQEYEKRRKLHQFKKGDKVWLKVREPGKQE
jgi:hypothetical protein